MTSRLLMKLQVVVSPPEKFGTVPHGTRTVVPVTGGGFEGPRLRGLVLPGGGDWLLLRSDGVLELDLRITLTVSGSLGAAGTKRLPLTPSPPTTSEIAFASGAVARLTRAPPSVCNSATGSTADESR